ncbi:FKBP-type peptidyl-prolyl cis-trans isomerase [Membranihabitans maritimus]|uniref:FKBP-type peptidyl-prolyl cis-trans isomerase n=1 Tax=Membranihabitans maritimus TaxID=2904244 RepID=UPI001F00BE68|nr:FKBP-type peptidyl-prolyl cis-trans isomerase [Membranihabitans maritimus]
MKLANLLFLSLGFLVFTSCEKEETIDRVAHDDEIIMDYLSTNNIDATKHQSGLYYLIEEEGNGEHPHSNSLVTVDYQGYLLDGTVFDSGRIEGQNLQGYIQGWVIGIPLFSEGGKGKLFLPSYLAYGSRSQGPIAAHSVLVFDVELINFK